MLKMFNLINKIKKIKIRIIITQSTTQVKWDKRVLVTRNTEDCKEWRVNGTFTYPLV